MVSDEREISPLFDDHVCQFLKRQQVNLVLDYAVEYTPDPRDRTKMLKTEMKSEILLNGNQIAVLVPGGAPNGSAAATSSSST